MKRAKWNIKKPRESEKKNSGRARKIDRRKRTALKQNHACHSGVKRTSPSSLAYSKTKLDEALSTMLDPRRELKENISSSELKKRRNTGSSRSKCSNV